MTVTPRALVHTDRAFHAFCVSCLLAGSQFFSAEILSASGEGTALVRYGKAKHAFNREQSLFSPKHFERKCGSVVTDSVLKLRSCWNNFYRWKLMVCSPSFPLCQLGCCFFSKTIEAEHSGFVGLVLYFLVTVSSPSHGTKFREWMGDKNKTGANVNLNVFI